MKVKWFLWDSKILWIDDWETQKRSEVIWIFQSSFFKINQTWIHYISFYHLFHEGTYFVNNRFSYSIYLFLFYIFKYFSVKKKNEKGRGDKKRNHMKKDWTKNAKEISMDWAHNWDIQNKTRQWPPIAIEDGKIKKEKKVD